MNLSAHFTLAEAIKSHTAIRLGIDNSAMSFDVEEALRATADNILEPVRTHWGIPFAPQSWYRCLELNRALRSKDTSQHVLGHAVDIEIPGISNIDLARHIVEELDFDQLILECFTGPPSSGWVHCSYTGANHRHEILTYDGNTFTAGIPA